MLFILFTVYFQISYTVEFFDTDTKRPIKNVEAIYNSSLYISDDNGRISFEINPNVNILNISHVSYLDSVVKLIFQSDNLKLRIYLTKTEYSQEINVTADILVDKPVSEMEIKSSKISLSKFQVQSLLTIDDAVSTLSSVSIKRSINGKTQSNIYGSEASEVNYRVNFLNLYLYSLQESNQHSINQNFLKTIEIEHASYNHFLATVNNTIDINAQHSIQSQLTNKLLLNSVLYNYNYENFNSLNSISHKIERIDFQLESQNTLYEYDYLTNHLKYNNYNFFKYKQVTIQNINLIGYSKNEYMKDIYFKTKDISSGLNIDFAKYFNLSNQFQLRNTDYKNHSNLVVPLQRKEYILQNEFDISKTIGDSANGLFLNYKNTILYNKLNHYQYQDLSKNKAYDLEHNILFRKKFNHDKQSIEEKKIVLETNLNVANYEDKLFIKSMGVKSSIILDIFADVLFYNEMNYSKLPIYRSNRLYLNQSDSSDYIQNTNIMFGAKFIYRNFHFDLNYSNRNYKNYLSKIYGLIYDEFIVRKNVIIKSTNFELKYFFDNFSTDLSAQFLQSDQIEHLSNRPELMISSNILYRLNSFRFRLLFKSEINKNLVFNVNNSFYKHAIDDEHSLDFQFSIDQIFSSQLSLNFILYNLLSSKKYTINGFYIENREYMMSAFYEFN